MSGFEPTKQHTQDALLFCFNLKKVLLKIFAKRQKAWILPGEPGPSMPKHNIHAQKAMLVGSRRYGIPRVAETG